MIHIICRSKRRSHFGTERERNRRARERNRQDRIKSATQQIKISSTSTSSFFICPVASNNKPVGCESQRRDIIITYFHTTPSLTRSLYTNPHTRSCSIYNKGIFEGTFLFCNAYTKLINTYISRGTQLADLLSCLLCAWPAMIFSR